MLAADNVVYLVGRVRVLLMEEAVFAAMERPLGYETAQRIIEISRQRKGCAEPRPSP